MNLKYDEIERYSNIFERITAIVMADPWLMIITLVILVISGIIFFVRFGRIDKDWMVIIIITQIVMCMMFIPLTIVALASEHDVSISTLAGKGYYQSEPMKVIHIDRMGKTVDGNYKLVSYELTSKDGKHHVFNTDTLVKGISKGDTVRLTTKEAVLVDKDDEVEAIYDNQNSDDIKLSFTPSDMRLREVY